MFYWLLFVLLFIFQLSVTTSQFHLYYTDHVSNNSLDHDCLLYNVLSTIQCHINSQETNPYQYQIIPYCIRPYNLSSSQLVNNEKSVIHGTPIKFETLQRENITSQQLYLLSASIDVVERYQEFLEKPNSSLSTQIFNNCSKPWFGEYCQYSFNLTWSFNRILWAYFNYLKQEINNAFKNGTCYIFLECNRGPSPSCLDWREICDGKIDCLDVGQDEIGCDMLHINECKENEFSCSNGFCIPKEFFNDDSLNPDCIDHSDEKYHHIEYTTSPDCDCVTDPTFRCEETTCRNERFLSCGDGLCTMDRCHSGREVQLKKAKLSQNANSHLSFNCWISLICLTIPSRSRKNLFSQVECEEKNKNENLFRESCPPLFFFPIQPIMLSHVRFAYANDLTNKYEFDILLPHYVCYDQELCKWIPATILIHGLTCRRPSELDIGKTSVMQDDIFETLILNFFLKCSTTTIKYVKCPKSKPYRCANSSKCIALNRLLDGFPDCFQGDDEQITNNCSLPDIDYRFRCSSEKKCVPITSINTPKWMCIGGEDASKIAIGSNPMNFHLSFTILCDGFIDHSRIDGLNYTDETDCDDDWPCNNAYTRCDGKWNCRNAIDEANCLYNPCRPNGHPCILPFSHNFTCLSLSRINDGHIDCVGGYDEQDRCGPKSKPIKGKTYRCFNETQCIYRHDVCGANVPHCSSGDDQDLWCKMLRNFSYSIDYDNIFQQLRGFDYYLYWHQLIAGLKKDFFVYFTLKNHLLYPPPIETITNEHNSIAATTMETVHFNPLDFEWFSESINHGLSPICNRGIPIYINNFPENSCLCPPAYFGYRCEYQNQRISLTLKFRTTELRTVFNFVIMLIDENTNIHSSEQLDFVYVRDCRKKFNLYLLYSTRPKNINRTYYVRIDTYNKEKMEYYASMIYPIQYSFLPVHRLSLQVNVPVPEVKIKSKTCPLKCVHGQCRHFSNSDQYFCQCSKGYSGMLCTIENSCDCSSDSICIGVVNNRSICVCPLDKFGPRCYLKRTACISNLCSNNGRCIPGGEKNLEIEYFCLCSQGYMGSRCEHLETKIEFHFSKTIFIPQTIFIHFVYIPPTPGTLLKPLPPDPTQITMMSKLKFHESSTVVYYGGSFHLIFVEFQQQYYLALLQHNFTLAMNFSTTIIPEHRCLSIEDLFTDDIRTLPRWHRVKKYYIPCQKHSNLTCFYDNDYFMCLCDIDRYPNCFKFDYPSTYNCLGYNYCENNGQCFQDNNTCPTSSACLCKECYYGSRCQFTTIGFGLSLDDILGYNIWPNMSFSRQPTVVKVTTAFTILMFVIAIINGVLSVITFRTKRSLGIGSGVHLLASSITSLLTMTLFTLKFFLLVFSQMSIITNYSFLLLHCICTDILLKAFLAIGEWLNACVSIEQIFTIQLGTKFNRISSKKAAKRVIFGLYLFILASFLHDPLNRYLLEDPEEQRTWCI
ncbi:unnamed protein product, partial [Rotaria sp. Silwood1]